MARKATTSRVAVFTDASTSRGNAGIGIYVPTHQIAIAEGLVRVPETDGVAMPVNWAELSAIKRALDLLGHLRPVIHTDSMWCVKVLTGRWNNNKYRHLVKSTRLLVKHHGAGVVWVPRTRNNHADSLARWASGYYPRPPEFLTTSATYLSL